MSTPTAAPVAAPVGAPYDFYNAECYSTGYTKGDVFVPRNNNSLEVSSTHVTRFGFFDQHSNLHYEESDNNPGATLETMSVLNGRFVTLSWKTRLFGCSYSSAELVFTITFVNEPPMQELWGRCTLFKYDDPNYSLLGTFRIIPSTNQFIVYPEYGGLSTFPSNTWWRILSGSVTYRWA